MHRKQPARRTCRHWFAVLPFLALLAVTGFACLRKSETERLGQPEYQPTSQASGSTQVIADEEGGASGASVAGRSNRAPGQENLSPNSGFPAARNASEPPRQRTWEPAFLNQHAIARAGDPVRFELTGGQEAAGVLENIQFRNGSVIYIDGQMTEPAPGRFFFQDLAAKGLSEGLAGVITFSDGRPSYRVEGRPDGTFVLLELPKDQVVCVNYAEAPENMVEEIPPLNPSDSPDRPIPPYQDGIISLQSRPGAPGVVYLDFRGGRTEGEGWGTFDFEKPNVSNAQIKDVWKRVAEDFLPFTINVTTDIQVYEAAAANSKARCIVSPTSTAAPGAGGVAYVGSWGGGVCWSFYTSGKSAAEVISHEVGHTLGLGHDGRTTPSEGYFGGHGSGSVGWAPIMGVGYYQPVAQWSRGEYASANNTQDDLAIIAARPGAGYRVDDTGNSLVGSRYLEAYPGNTVSQEGVIERTADTDAFQFTTTGGVISLQVRPVNGEWADLAISATLVNELGTVLSSNNPQSQLNAAVVASVPAGTYTVEVTGVGRNNPLTDGFSSYASLGYYSITGSVGGIRLPSRFVLNESSPNGTIVGTVTASGVGTRSYSIVGGNNGGAFAIDNDGVLTVANSAALDYETLALNTSFKVQYELFVNIVNETDPLLTELNRRVVVEIRDVNEPPVMSGSTQYVFTGTPAGTPILAMNATDPDFFTVLNYSIVGGNGAGLFAIGSTDGILRLAVSPSQAQAGTYNLSVRAADTTASPVSTTVLVQVNVITNQSPFVPGGIAYAVYDGIGGSAVADLTGNSRFPRDPNWEKIQPSFDADTDRASSFGSVMRGYVIAPVTGSYTFFVASDDNSSLLFSMSTNPAAAVQIASVVGGGGQTWTDRYQWTKYSTQRSGPLSLVAGQAYYIEARHKEGSGGDHLSVAWAGPHTGGQTNVISGVYLSPAYLNYIPRVAGFSANVRRDSMQGLRVGRLTITDANTNETATCTILSGNSEGLFAVDNLGWVSVANATALATTPTSSFSLSVRVTDSGSPALSATATVSLTLIGATNLPPQLRRELFQGISGNSLGSLTNHAKYPYKPDSLDTLTSFSSAVNVGDGYGSRIRAYVVPPATGNYRFWLSSDDSGALNLSSDASPENVTTIASIADGNWSDPNQWTKYPSQTSAFIPLVAGQRYYIETIHKENSGGDSVQVAWAGPGLAAGTNIISSAYLRPFDINFPPVVSGFLTLIPQTTANGAYVGTIQASDGPMDNLAFQIDSGNTGDTFALDPLTGVITVNDNTLIANGNVSAFHLSVRVQDSGYGGLYPLKSTNVIARIGVQPPGSTVQGLRHRYSFTSNTLDSVGTSHAVLQGTASVAGGRLLLQGGGAARANCASLNLATTFSSNPSLSFEAWCSVGTHQTWSKLWMFGQPNSGVENGMAYVDFTPLTGSTAGPSMSFNSNVGGELNTRTAPNPSPMAAGTEYHVICAYDAPRNEMRLYINGVLVDSASMGGGNMLQVPASQGFLGAAVHYGDPNLIGNFNEFRVWNIPISGLQVALNAAAGPDVALSASAATATHLSAASTNINPGQTVQVQVTSDFNVVNIPTTSYATNWTSSNPSVAAVSTNGLVTAHANGFVWIHATVAGATGSLLIWVGPVPPQFTEQPEPQVVWVGDNAVFTASASGTAPGYQWRKNGSVLTGQTNTTLVLSNVTLLDAGEYSVTASNAAAQLTSAPAQLTVRKPELLHRWSFNDGLDSVGGAHASLVGSASYAGGRLQLPGGAARANCATVNLASTLGTNGSLSVETWFTMSALQDWSKVWMFGRAEGGVEPGLAYIEFTPRAGVEANVPSTSFNSGIAGSEQNTRGGLNPPVLATGVEYHVVSVFDAAADQIRLYVNGALADTGSMNGGNITQLNANEAYFGAAVSYPDLNLQGNINEIRIWSTPLNATLVADSFAAGSDSLVNYQPSISLTVEMMNGQPSISWPVGTLESADTLEGPWSAVEGAVSPYSPSTLEPQKFYRVKVN